MILRVRIMFFLYHFHQYSIVMVASVIGGGNRITLRKPKIQVHLSMNVNLTDKFSGDGH